MIYSRNMTQVQTFHHTDFGFRLQCVYVDGDAWFKADDAAAILGYTNTAEAISGFDDDDAKTLRELIPEISVGCVAFYAHRDTFKSMCGIFELAQMSQHQEANNFRKWLWSDIIKGLHKMLHPHLESCSNNEEEEEEEESLCVRLIKHIRKTYPDAVAFVGRSDNQHVGGVLKGWQSGVLVIRGTPNGIANVCPVNLDQSYESAVVALHEHYQETFKGAKRVAKNEEEEEEWYDFSTNRNPKYWLRKFNKTTLMKECDRRGLIVNDPMMTLNLAIVEALITADTI